MAPKVTKAEKKVSYDKKMCRLLDEYAQVLVVAADNVGSTQLQNIRKGLRGHSIVLMGKNTMMKRTVRIHSETTGNTAILNLVPLLVVSIGGFCRFSSTSWNCWCCWLSRMNVHGLCMYVFVLLLQIAWICLRCCAAALSDFGCYWSMNRLWKCFSQNFLSSVAFHDR